MPEHRAAAHPDYTLPVRKHGPECLPGTACRRADRNGSSALPLSFGRVPIRLANPAYFAKVYTQMTSDDRISAFFGCRFARPFFELSINRDDFGARRLQFSTAGRDIERVSARTNDHDQLVSCDDR
jgi:hypothetical protein